MSIKQGDTLNLYYTGRFESGGIFDSNVGKKPFTFTVGAGQVIEGFDKAVIGMRVGEKKEFKVAAEEGYGLSRDDFIFELNKEAVGLSEAKVGDAVTLKTEDGGFVNASIISVNKDRVIIDANHPLAGKELHFEIEIV